MQWDTTEIIMFAGHRRYDRLLSRGRDKGMFLSVKPSARLMAIAESNDERLGPGIERTFFLTLSMCVG